MRDHKYIFVTGGVCSSVGKGVCCASLGALLEMHGYSVNVVKIDPYLNVDAGTMSPYQHGEVFVLDDGTETDLDLGNYARFTRTSLTKFNSITTGKVYDRVIRKERKGEYLGQTVQVFPHIIEEISHCIEESVNHTRADITLVELGGTVGDVESLPFLEAVRQIILEKGKHHTLCVHVTLLPVVNNEEVKTKPTQHSVRELMNRGLSPDVLVCRSSVSPDETTIQKLAQFTGVNIQGIAISLDAPTIYQVPLTYHEKQLDSFLLNRLQLPFKFQQSLFLQWSSVVDNIINSQKTVHIALIGKYTKQKDTYRSILEALYHGCLPHKLRLNLQQLEAQELEESVVSQELAQFDGIVIPGGFGERGTIGLLEGISYARTHGKPMLAICYGMQLMVVEYARNILQLDAQTTEIQMNTPNPVVIRSSTSTFENHLGGTMRLGAAAITLAKGSQLQELYQKEQITERHRHRYEVNHHYAAALEKHGLKISAQTSDNKFIEAVEWENHPFGIGVQFHPEFLSTPLQPHPLFSSFIGVSHAQKSHSR